MKSQEKPEIPVEICPTCYNPKSAHAVDCDYEKKVAHHNKSEGITPEFEAGVKSGEITFDKQMEEVSKFWDNLQELSPIPEKREFDPKKRVEESLIRFADGVRRLKSCDPNMVQRAFESNEKIVSLVLQMGHLDGAIRLCLRDIGENRSLESIDLLEKLTIDYANLAEEVVEKINSLNL